MTTRIEWYYGLCVYDTKSSSWYTTNLFLLIQRGSNDNTTVVVFTAPRFFLETRIRNYKDDNTTDVVGTAPRLLRGIPQIPRMHDDEDGMTTMRMIILHGYRFVYYAKSSSCKNEYMTTRMILILLRGRCYVDCTKPSFWKHGCKTTRIPPPMLLLLLLLMLLPRTASIV